MIKVNLLEGAADTRAATRATKAAAKTTQQVLLIAGALLALLIAVGVDYFVSKAQLDRAERELAEQKQISEELKKNREQLDALQKQIKQVEDRIKIIEDLRKTQQGPSTLLELVNAKLPPRGIQLNSISQSGDNLSIQGTADDAQIISDFARGLELGSNGLFQSIGLDVQRREEARPDPEDPETNKTVVVYGFTVRTKYTPTLVGQPAEGTEGQAGGQSPAPAPAK